MSRVYYPTMLPTNGLYQIENLRSSNDVMD